MKFGFRKPSFKRSLSAATKGAATRALKKAILPGYGKGYYTGYKKLAYNRLYSLTTASVFDLFKSSGRKNPQNLMAQAAEIEEKKIAISIRREGLRQYDKVTDFVKEYQKDNLNKSIQNALNRLQSYSNRYLNKGVYCGENLYQFVLRSIGELKETAVKGITKYECTIVMDIVSQMEQGVDSHEVIEAVRVKYVEKKSADFSQSDSLEEFAINPNGVEEGRQQLEVFNDLSAKISSNKHIFMPEVRIKLLNLVIKYYGLQRRKVCINLYDYFELELSKKLLSSKREITKSEYQQALDIVNLLKAGKTVDDVYEYLEKRYSR